MIVFFKTDYLVIIDIHERTIVDGHSQELHYQED